MMDEVMNTGNSNRTVGFTNMNAPTSRSHSIFSITLEYNSTGPDGKRISMKSKNENENEDKNESEQR
jgi:Kinesin motor domain